LSHNFINPQLAAVFLLNHNLYLVIRRQEKGLLEDHLGHRPRRRCVELDLREEVIHRLDQVLIEVEVIVCHLSGHHKESLSSTLCLKLLRLTVWNKRVFLTVQDERWAEDFGHQVYVFKSLLNEIAQ